MSVRLEPFARFCKERPLLVAYVLVGAIAGAGLTLWFDLGPSHPAGKIIGGAVAGGCFALFPMGERLFE